MVDPSQGVMQELDPLIGLTISGRYRVHTLIGQGGMGKVFQAQQIPLGRQVALKVLEASGVDQEFHRRFFQEAAILAKLQSRHTVTVYDYGRDGDVYFIAMELVAGGSLDRVLAAEGPFPARRALAITTQICRSLREAHAQGIIHRDLKPGNVMLTRSEEGEEHAKVLDFGLAKRVDRAAGEDTQTDTVPGSPKYMAPEVIRQQPIDGRADMYGLGVMLYQMITGVVPFDRPNLMDILVAHLQETPRPMRLANPGVEVPEPLERLVARCLAKHPEERYADMQTLIEALKALAMELGLHSEPSWVGTSLAPDPSQHRGDHGGPSGVRPTAERLRLEARDISPLRSDIRGPSRAPRAPMIFGVIGAVALAGAIWFFRGDADAPPPPAPPAPSPAAPAAPPPTATAPAAAEQVDLAHPDMVFAPEDIIPTLAMTVSSDPPGASVWLSGEKIGVTPLTYGWRHADAAIGRELTLVLKLPGYATKTLKQPITAAQMTFTASLQANADSDIKALGERAAALQQRGEAPSPILTVKPAETEPAPAAEEAPAEGEAHEPAAEEPKAAEPEAHEGAGAVDPNPYAPPQ